MTIRIAFSPNSFAFGIVESLQCVMPSLYTSVRHAAQVKCPIKIAVFVNFMRKFFAFLQLFVLKFVLKLCF